MVETKISNSEILSYSQKRKGFHEKYLNICKIKLIKPLAEVKGKKQTNIQVLDFHADRLKVNDWLAISNALQNDCSLKYITIRLRKNDEFVLENVDTVKKAKLITSVPVIYSKFLLNVFIQSMQSMLTNNNQLEILSLEGLPFGSRYILPLANGLCNNQSIKILNFSRSNIGDEGCEILCSNIKHLTNIESLNLSNCNIGIKGVIAVRDFIKYQKIHRFSEAWIQSLRYQNIQPSSLGGLRKILLNHNTQIGDEGLKILTSELCEDAWINDIEMQNCGLTDEAAEEIINCLNINKTILYFNVSNNLELSDHLIQQIMLRLGSSDSESYASSDSKKTSEKITKVQLLDKIKYLEEQLESEKYKNKRLEEQNEKLVQMIEDQKQICDEYSIQEKYANSEELSIPINNDLNKQSMSENEEFIPKTSPSNIAVRLRRKRRNLIRRVSSAATVCSVNRKISRSEIINRMRKSKREKQFIQENIGDTAQNNIIQFMETKEKGDDTNIGSNLLKTFQKAESTLNNYSINTLFQKYRPNNPNNSEEED